MKVLFTFDQITVEQYQEIEPLIEGDEDSWSKILSILSKQPIEKIESFPIWKLKYYFTRLSFLRSKTHRSKPSKFIWLNWRLYKATRKAEDLNTARYISIQTLLQDGSLDSKLTDICALTYVPLTIRGFKYNGSNHTKIAEDFKKASYGKVYPAVFFCLRTSEHFTVDTLLSSSKVITQRVKEMAKQIQDQNILITGGGLQPLTK